MLESQLNEKNVRDWLTIKSLSLMMRCIFRVPLPLNRIMSILGYVFGGSVICMVFAGFFWFVREMLR